jgi:hypothetical protein
MLTGDLRGSWAERTALPRREHVDPAGSGSLPAVTDAGADAGADTGADAGADTVTGTVAGTETAEAAGEPEALEASKAPAR